VQFLRGDLSADQTMNFGTLFNAFLAIYQVRYILPVCPCLPPSNERSHQVFSSENWTDILYSTAGAEKVFGQSAISVLFIAGWMLFANCTCHLTLPSIPLCANTRTLQSSCCRCSSP
jgi:hypothetical protein